MRDPRNDLRIGYPQRMLFSFVVTLLFANVLLLVWPVQSGREIRMATSQAEEREVIQVAEVLPTRHGAVALEPVEGPPAAAPLPPVVIPDDIILEEEELDLSPVSAIAVQSTNQSTGNPDGAPESAAVGEGSSPATNSIVPPKLMRVVLPEVTREARRRNILAEVKMEVLVDERGFVQHVRIIERYMLTPSGKRKVDVLGFGLEEAFLSAAKRCLFHPGQKNGQPIEATQSLILGIK